MALNSGNPIPLQLLQEAIQDAEQSAAGVRAAALVHIARVMTVFDKEEAGRLLDRGIALTEGLLASDRDILMPEVIATAAAVSPDRSLELYSALGEGAEWIPNRLVITMLDHGHTREAARYLSSPRTGIAYPFIALGNTMGSCRGNPELQQSMLRGAINAATWPRRARSHASNVEQSST